MIYDSESRQGALHAAIIEFQKNAPMQPQATAWEQQQFLKEQVKDLEAQIASYPPDSLSGVSGIADQWDDSQLRQLGSELKTLEENYVQFKSLMAKMAQKVQRTSITVSQHLEGQKLQDSMDDLKRQTASLRTDLTGLRNQMIDLDKRKSILESMIQTSP